MLLALVAAATCGAGCSDFDVKRATPPRGSLGRELYTLVCDRVGAQALREDVTGASYHAACHADADGRFADKVDAAALPELDPEARDTAGKPVPLETQKARRAHRIARVEAVARRRDDVIAAFDAAFPEQRIAIKDVGNPDPAKSCDPPGEGRSGEADLREEVALTLGRLVDLYNDDTIPHLTRSLARVMDDLEQSDEAKAALARFDARRGYRPADVAMGVAEPALGYPHLADLANALLRLLAADSDPYGPREGGKPTPGAAHDALVKLLEITREEMRTAEPSPTPGALTVTPDVVDPLLDRLSRPRGNLEAARALLLTEDKAYTSGSPRWITLRDARGLAAVPLDRGALPAPFVDATGPAGGPDGLPDVDPLGRFVTVGVAAPTPFEPASTLLAGPGGTPAVPRDAFGRFVDGSRTRFAYVDLNASFIGAVLRDVTPLVERRHMVDLLGGFFVAAGARDTREATTRTYPADPRAAKRWSLAHGGAPAPGGIENAPVNVKYRAFRDDDSPLLDLVWAVGQVLGHPSADDTLALVQRLASEHPQTLARLVGVGLEIKRIADAHPEAKIPDASTLWDDLLDVIVKMAQRPKLFEDLIRAFGRDETVELADVFATYMTRRDELTYDRANLNGPAFNKMTGRVTPMITPVDRARPDVGTNRSALQRFMQLLHDANGLAACTKDDAVAHVQWNGIAMDYPTDFAARAACLTLTGSLPPSKLPRCGILRFDNVAELILDVALGRAKFDIRDRCLARLVESPLTGFVGGADAFLEEISGIKGFNLHPTVNGVARFAFFDTPHDGLPGDAQNPKTRRFLTDLLDPVPSKVCRLTPFTDTDGKVIPLRECSSFADTLRGRDDNALFPLEQMDFIRRVQPLAAAFGDNGGNLLFVDLFDALHVHWGSSAVPTSVCDPKAPRSDARWCSQDGAVSYEPLLAEAITKADLFPALHDSVAVLSAMKIPHCDTFDAKTKTCTKVTERDGVTVLAEAARALVDPTKNPGLTKRDGDRSATRNDGTKNAQVTPVYLLTDALVGFDRAFAGRVSAGGDDRLPGWRAARSALVDTFFAVDGAGKDAKLANPAVRRALPDILRVVRAQTRAHCPDPTAPCAWATSELPGKTRDVVTGPMFAATLDLLDAIRSDERARAELERMLVHLFTGAPRDASLAALADVLQVFDDDENVTALLHVLADAAGPEVRDASTGKVVERGMASALIEVLARVFAEARSADGARRCDREIDPNRTFLHVLRRLTAPAAPGKASPLEVLIDVAADVNRRSPEDTTKLTPDDYGSIAHEVSEFCTHPSRGLEQVYEVIRQATAR